MTLCRANNERLILLPSVNLAFSLYVFEVFILSDPAKSMKLTLDSVLVKLIID